MRRAANSERSTVVEESRKTPPEQVKGNCCSRSNIHTLLSLQYEGQLEDFGFLCSIAFMSIPLLAVLCFVMLWHKSAMWENVSQIGLGHIY